MKRYSTSWTETSLHLPISVKKSWKTIENTSTRIWEWISRILLGSSLSSSLMIEYVSERWSLKPSLKKTNLNCDFDPSRVTTAEPTNLIISRMSEESSLAELLDRWRSGMNRTINSPATLFRWSVRGSEYVVELIEDNTKNQQIITSLKKVSSDRNSSFWPPT